MKNNGSCKIMGRVRLCIILALSFCFIGKTQARVRTVYYLPYAAYEVNFTNNVYQAKQLMFLGSVRSTSCDENPRLSIQGEIQRQFTEHIESNYRSKLGVKYKWLERIGYWRWDSGEELLRMHAKEAKRHPNIELISTFFFNCNGGSTGTLRLNMSSYQLGELIKVQFTASPSFDKSAWIGVVPSNIEHGSESVNDKHDLAFAHINGKTDGTIRFLAPPRSGNYDIRMNDRDNGGREVASVSFTCGGQLIPRIYLEKKRFRAGEQISVWFSAPSYHTSAWIGIIRSNVPHGSESTNDQNDLQFRHLSGKQTGTMTFSAPQQPGKYDLRMNDNDRNGREVASISFVVTQ